MRTTTAAWAARTEAAAGTVEAVGRAGTARAGGAVEQAAARAVRRDAAAGRPADGGISTIEVVILAPLLILFVLVLVALGQLVDARGALDGAARDAARAGSLHGSETDANKAAEDAAKDDLKGICVGDITISHDGTDWAPAGVYTVQLSCQVRGLATVGLSIPTTLSSKFASPLDPYRRYE